MADSILPSIFSVWNKLQDKISSPASSSHPHNLPKLNKLNDMVYEVYTPPEERPELEIVFFHGLQLQEIKDAYVTSWMSRDNSHLWIQTWLVELFPRAHILTVSYDSSAEQTRECGMLDMYCTAENLVWSLIADEVRVGQARSPVVFVGHCLGGLVLKELCLSAASIMGRKSGKMPGTDRIRNLLSNIGGMFFYGTPHGGSVLGDKLPNSFKGALMEEMEILKVSSARRNQEFDDLRLKYDWRTYGMGESRKTYVESLGTYVHLVTEASSRQSMDTYYSANTDHYDICKAEGKKASALQQLGSFLRTILEDREFQAGVLADAKKTREYFIDLEGRANQLRSMLAQTEVHTIFIVGLSGIGKTTLARQVYSDICHNFDVTCFVSLDSIEGQSNGSDQVWRKIQESLEGIHIGSIRNIPSMPYQLKSKRVLMVLDNVESQGQLDVLNCAAWLEGSSSKLIVTSTTSRLGSPPCKTFEIGYLSAEESRQLFRHYAFQGGEGPLDLRDLILQVIAKCDGYPLFIKILARFVSKESAVHEKQVWLDLLSRLAKAEDVDGSPDYRLWAKLKVCYNSLLPSEQEIYLDIAIIFHGFRLSWLKRIWKASREEPGLAWLNLKSRFLVSESKGFIHMHAQLRNLGHSIACPRGATVEKWKRICGYSLTKELQEKLVSKDKGLMETLALKLEITNNDLFKLKKTTFQNYDHLQYLILEGGRTSSVTVWGKVKLPRSLVFLRWINGVFTVCPLDFSRLEKLAGLELLYCKSMKYLPPSIVEASNLTWLELEGCASLRELPLGLSKFLQYLGLDETGLKKLPNDYGNFKELLDLKVSQTKLTRVPEGIRGLEILSCLDLSKTEVTTLPDSVGDLKCLKNLNLQKTKLTSLPNSIGRLQALEELNLHNTMLISLPNSIGLLTRLRTLDLGRSTLQSLPESTGGLQELELLVLSGTCVKSLPQSIGNLLKLETLSMGWTPLETLPDSIGKLCQLSYLSLSDTHLRTLPETMGELAGLKLLDLSHTPLQSVPRSLTKLSRLNQFEIDIGGLVESVESEEARREGEGSAPAARDWLAESTIHSFFPRDLPFHDMTELTLSGRGYPQSWVQPLFLSFQKMPSLMTLKLVDFNLVEMIPYELGTLTSLYELEIKGWERLRELPESLGKLCELKFLTLENNPSLCTLPETLGQLRKLGGLTLLNNSRLCKLPESLCALSSLQNIQVRNCGSLEKMPRSLCLPCTSKRESSTSEGEESTQSDSLQATAPPQLHLNTVSSDMLSLLECFFKCRGNHFSRNVIYHVECEEIDKARKEMEKVRREMEKARKLATNKYILDPKAAQDFSGNNNCLHRAFRPSTSQCPGHHHSQRLQNSYIRCKISRCKVHTEPIVFSLWHL